MSRKVSADFVFGKQSNSPAVPPRAKGKRNRNREEVKPLSGLKIDELLSSTRRETRISRDNAISEFKQMLDNADGADNAGLIRDAAKQMGDITRELIKSHEGASAGTIVEQALENIRVMREEMLQYEDPDSYNKFIRALKKDLLNGNLGENRRELWLKIKWAKLGLIDNEVEEKSNVSVAEAHEFLRVTEVDLLTRNK
jgi:ATP-dependent DNA helicase 2 subunit 2